MRFACVSYDARCGEIVVKKDEFVVEYCPNHGHVDAQWLVDSTIKNIDDAVNFASERFRLKNQAVRVRDHVGGVRYMRA